MKREYKLILLISIFTLGFISLEDPLRDFLNQYLTNKKTNELVAHIVDRIVLFTILLLTAKKLGLFKFNGINRKPHVKNKTVFIVPIILILLGVGLNLAMYKNSGYQLLTLFGISVLLTGLVEELCIRGLVLPLFIESKEQNRFLLYYGVVLSALLFGVMHYFNLISQPGNFWGVTRQVFFGIAMGVFFGALMLRSGNVFIVAVCHGFVNFILGNKILGEGYMKQVMVQSANSIDLISFLPTLAIFCIIILIGLNMIRKVDKNEIKEELKYLNI